MSSGSDYPDSEDFDFNNGTGPVYDREWMMYNYHGYEKDGQYLKKLEGFPWVYANICMILLFPAVLIANILLLVVIFRNRKLRNQSWRWLIAHTALCIFVTAFFYYIDLFTSVYHVHSFETTSICPGIKVITVLFWQMIPISLTLVVIERFCVIKRGNELGGGMGKKTVIITLTVFWLLNIIVHVVSFVTHHYGPPFTFRGYLPGMMMCYLHDTAIAMFAKFIISVWSALSIIVIIIGSAILGHRTVNMMLKQFVVMPTVIASGMHLVFYLLPYYVEMTVLEMGLWPGDVLLAVFHGFFVVSWIAFPIIWLVSWSLNDDITWSREIFLGCLPGQHQEEFQMMQDNEQG